MKTFPKIDAYSLIINENKAKSVDRVVDAYDRAVKELDEKDNIITGLHMEIDDLKKTISSLNQRIEQDALYRDKNSIPFSKISTEAKIRFNDIKEMSLAKVLSSSDFIKVDTTTVVSISWNKKLADSIMVKNERELRTWIQKELKTDKIQITRK